MLSSKWSQSISIRLDEDAFADFVCLQQARQERQRWILTASKFDRIKNWHSTQFYRFFIILWKTSWNYSSLRDVERCWNEGACRARACLSLWRPGEQTFSLRWRAGRTWGDGSIRTMRSFLSCQSQASPNKWHFLETTGGLMSMPACHTAALLMWAVIEFELVQYCLASWDVTVALVEWPFHECPQWTRTLRDFLPGNHSDFRRNFCMWRQVFTMFVLDYLAFFLPVPSKSNARKLACFPLNVFLVSN